MCASDRRILPLMGAGNSARAVGAAGVVLIAASLIGGAVSVVAGVNTWSTAWTSQATLAAPWPMLSLIRDGRDGRDARRAPRCSELS
jgi:phosphatidylserine synthase